MTVRQDQPPLSRRQLRESERGASAQSAPGPFDQDSTIQTSTAQSAVSAVPVSAVPGSAVTGSAVTVSAAPVSSAATGRRAHQSESTSSVPDTASLHNTASGGQRDGGLLRAPLRPLVPSYDAPSFRDRSITAVPVSASAAPAAVFTERASAVDQHSVEPTAWQLSQTDQTDDSPSFESDSPADRPLTRRELRARGLGGFTSAIPLQDAAALATPSLATEASSSARAASLGTVVFESSSSNAPAGAVKHSGTVDGMFAPGTALPGSVMAMPEDELKPSSFGVFGSQAVSADAGHGPATTFAPPVGHWSTQAGIDDTEQVLDAPFGRDVAATSGAITTSALVLPSVPTADDMLGPLSGTGEILITGSINLPSSMGSTGVQPARYDHSDVDALLEADDREDSHQDSAPVRAIRAISTATAAGDVVASMKPRKTSKLPIIITLVGSVLIVGVVVLLVIGASLGFFK